MATMDLGCRLVRLVVLLVAMLASPAWAQMKQVPPGQVPDLGADEGLVLLSVDSDIDLYRAHVLKDGRQFGGGMLSGLKAGRSFRLYQASAGRYGWNELKPVPTLGYRLRDDPELGFEVRPGRINYGGDLVFRPIGLWRASMRMSNRSLAALDWLQAQHPQLLDRYAFEYSGRYPDPFPAFYLQQRQAHPQARPAQEVALLPPPPPGPLPVAVETLWKEGRIVQASINPAGTLMAMHARSDDAWTVELVDLRAHTVSTMATSAAEFEQMVWAGDDALLATVEVPGDGNRVTVIRIATDAQGRRSYERIAISRPGWVVDPLPQDPTHILFASISSDGQPFVHRLDISSQKAVTAFRPTPRTRLNTAFRDDVGWIAGQDGRLRFAMVRSGDDGYRLVRPAEGGQAEVMRLGGDFDPVGASQDGATIYGITDEGRGQRELVAYDVAGGRIASTLFGRDGVDVEAALFDARQNVIGVVYYSGGRRVSEYFQADDSRLAQQLERAFPGRTVTVGDRSRDGRQLALWVEAPEHPPQLYHLDADRGTATLVDDDRPWLQGVAFAPTRVLSFRGPDGLPLEAFLTLPAAAGAQRVPLVVFPHGGPMGVADRLRFDPEVQFLASLGYAVLQVNFRGSDGYGRAFREAAQGAIGTGIEDDIDAAIGHALAHHPLDGTRMCMLGGSYGGYSALFSAIRWPQRFRCAVSIAGVSDRILQFSASDSAQHAQVRALMEKLMGDPRRDAEAMRQTSPVYRHDELRTPVMLAHGPKDPRVDFEHARRMLRMLDMDGRTPVGLELEGEGHSVEKPENRKLLWQGVAGFLRQHLGPAPAAP